MKNFNLFFTFLLAEGWKPTTHTIKSCLSSTFTTIAIVLLLTGSLQAGLTNQCTPCTKDNGCDKQDECESLGCVWTDGSPNNICSDPAGNTDPQITSTAFSLQENNGVLVGTVLATDTDIGDTLTFSTTLGGVDSGEFTITSGGVLSFTAVPDYENPTDTDANNIYVVIVEVSDGNGGTDSQTITVTVTNDTSDDNTNPQITSTAFSIQENSGTSVGTVIATDDDVGDILTFSTTLGGVDSGEFTITAGGALSFNTAPDYENPTDSGTNNIYEVIVSVSDDNGGTDSQTITVTVTNDTSDDPTTPSASIADASIVEGNSSTTTLDFTVTLSSAAPAGGVTLDYATSDGTATTADNDYVSSSSTLTIAEGATTGTISVTINGDTTAESDETFTVTLSNPSGATLNTATATGTITDDDTVIPSASIADASIDEGDSGTSTLNFTVTLDVAAPSGGMTVDYATSDETATTADSDYVSSSGTLTIAEGDTNGTIAVTINGDTNTESDETFTVTLSNPINSTLGTATATGTITNDDAVVIVEVNNAEDLCYIINTPIEDSAGDCLQEGNFWYGNGCETSVTIVDTNVSSEDLTNLVVTKMYSPTLDHGSAHTTEGTIRESGASSGGVSPLAITEYTSYTEGYIVDINNLLVSDANFTLTDYDSYNNGNKMYGIALYAEYNVSDEHHTGRILACTGGEGGIEIVSAGDVIDTPIENDGTIAGYYNASNDTSSNGNNIKYIQTMIAADTTKEIAGVYLNLDGDTEIYTYTGEVKGNSDPLPFQLTPLWADSTCSTTYGNVLNAAGNRLVLEVPSGSYSSQKVAITVPNYVRKDYRMQMIVVDPNGLSVEGQNCLDGSTTGNFEQLAQCVNSEVQYLTAFGQDAWDRCGLDGGAPCESNNHGSADPTDPSYDPATDHIYTNPLGCYMCTFDIQPSCSSDNFAIRPKAFDVNISDGDTFISGEMTNLKFEAINANDTTETFDYNETEDSSFSVDVNITDATKTCPTTIELNPSVQFVDGIDNDDFFFNDVGKDLNFTVQEINGSEYAFVDADDSNDTVRFITPFERNISVIPDRFIIEGNLTDHNTDNNFTYLHDINKYDLDDNYSMAATLSIDIKAVGADDNITRNYMETCYAEDTNVTLSLGSTDITYPGAVPLTHFLYYNPEEDNGTADSGEGNYTLPAPIGNTISFTSLPIENIPSTFPADAPDGNGTTFIEYKLNFDRQEHLVVNPFKMILSDVNITDTDGVEGTDNVNQSATLQYARSRSSKFFYEDIVEQNVNTPIIIDVYCDLSFTACDNLSIDTVNGQINEVNWWLSLGHNTANDDGNITLTEGAVTEGNSTDWSVTPNVNITTNASDPNIIVDRGTNPTLPLTVEIELDETNPRDTDHWLIYNDKYPMPLSPFYKVRFIGTSGWAGHGKTGHVVDSNTSIKKNRRLEW